MYLSVGLEEAGIEHQIARRHVVVEVQFAQIGRNLVVQVVSATQYRWVPFNPKMDIRIPDPFQNIISLLCFTSR